MCIYFMQRSTYFHDLILWLKINSHHNDTFFYKSYINGFISVIEDQFTSLLNHIDDLMLLF